MTHQEFIFSHLSSFGVYSKQMEAMRAAEQEPTGLSFSEVVTLHQRGVYTYLLRLTRNPHDAQDLFQETFLKACRAYASLPSQADHKTWLLRIATNLAKNYFRDRKRHGRVIVSNEQLCSPEVEHYPHKADGAEATVSSQETARILLVAIDALPFRQRAAFLQRKFEGLSYEAIAANLGCSGETARAHVYQALRKIRLSLDQANSLERGMQ